MDFFGAGVDGAKFGAGFPSRITSQETNEEFAGFDVAALSEGVPRDDIAKLGRRAVNDAGAKAEFAVDGFFDALGKSGEVALARAENDVAAIDVSLAASEFQGFVEGAEGVHFDLIAADDVDAAEQRDDGGHEAKYTTGAVFSGISQDGQTVKSESRARN